MPRISTVIFSIRKKIKKRKIFFRLLSYVINNYMILSIKIKNIIYFQQEIYLWIGWFVMMITTKNPKFDYAYRYNIQSTKYIWDSTRNIDQELIKFAWSTNKNLIPIEPTILHETYSKYSWYPYKFANQLQLLIIIGCYARILIEKFTTLEVVLSSPIGMSFQTDQSKFHGFM